MSAKSLRRAAAPLVVLLFAAGSPVFAQDWKGRGRLQGDVTDEQGKPIEGATVKLHTEKAAEQGPAPMKTDKKGHWGVLGLAGGNWIISVDAPGFRGKEGPVHVDEFGVNPSVKIQLERDVAGDQRKKQQAASAIFDEAQQAESRGQWADARAAFEKALAALDPKDVVNQSKVVLRIGNTYHQEKNYPEARTQYERALSLLDAGDASNRATALARIGDTFVEEKKFPEALEKLQAANALNANDAWTTMLLGRAYAGAGQKDKAIETVKAFTDAHPADLQGPQILADLYVETGHSDKAIEVLKVFCDAHPEQVDATQHLIGLLVIAGQQADANAYKAKLPAGTKMDPTTLLNQGIKAYNENKLQDALASFDQTVQENPNMSEAYYFRGLAYLAMGKTAEAKADLQKYLQIDPNGPNAKDCREFLKSL